MKNMIFLSALLFSTARTFAQQSDIEILKKTEQTRIGTFVTKDTSTLKKILSDDLVFVNTLGETLDKKKILSLIMDPDRKYISAKIDSITSARVIGSTGILMLKASLVRKLHDVMSILHNSYMAVYEKRKNKWMLVALHITLLSAK
jgi:hypothetical protein